MGDALGVMIAGAAGSDLLLVHLLGICPAIAVSRKLEMAAGLAVSTIMVAPPASLLSYLLLGLVPSGTGSMLALPIMVISVLVCLYFVANIGARVWPKAYAWLEPFVALMTVNCTLLGVVLLVLVEPVSAIHSFLYAVGLAVGYGWFLLVFSQLRERLATAAVPQAFRGTPIALLSAAIIAMAMSGLGGLA